MHFNKSFCRVLLFSLGFNDIFMYYSDDDDGSLECLLSRELHKLSKSIHCSAYFEC